MSQFKYLALKIITREEIRFRFSYELLNYIHKIRNLNMFILLNPSATSKIDTVAKMRLRMLK